MRSSSSSLPATRAFCKIPCEELSPSLCLPKKTLVRSTGQPGTNELSSLSVVSSPLPPNSLFLILCERAKQRQNQRGEPLTGTNRDDPSELNSIPFLILPPLPPQPLASSSRVFFVTFLSVSQVPLKSVSSLPSLSPFILLSYLLFSLDVARVFLSCCWLLRNTFDCASSYSSFNSICVCTFCA